MNKRSTPEFISIWVGIFISFCTLLLSIYSAYETGKNNTLANQPYVLIVGTPPVFLDQNSNTYKFDLALINEGHTMATDFLYQTFLLVNGEKNLLQDIKSVGPIIIPPYSITNSANLLPIEISKDQFEQLDTKTDRFLIEYQYKNNKNEKRLISSELILVKNNDKNWEIHKNKEVYKEE